MHLKIGLKNKIKDFVYWVNKSYKKIFADKMPLYDFQTNEVLKKVLTPTSNCIDIGCHEGAIFREMVKRSPKGKHFLFEPLPFLYHYLRNKYSRKHHVSNIALSDRQGSDTFFYIRKRPALSGLKKSKYIDGKADVERIEVELDTLDNTIPAGVKIDLIKIDVEGAEFSVLKGGKKLITKYKPFILFECGLGGADHYNITPGEIYDLLIECGLQVSLQEYFLKGCLPFTREEFVHQFSKGYNYFFIAYQHNNAK